MPRLLARGRGRVRHRRRGRRVLLKPPLVERAQALAFERSCSDETGRLLHALAAQRGRSRVGEIGTGVGVGAAWIASALAPGVPFVTVELDRARAAAARELLADDEDVRVLEGDWHELMPPEAPFDLLFYDGGGNQHPEVDGEQVLGLLAPGATLLMDDLTPGRPAGPDPVREFWLSRRELAAVELQVSRRECVIVAVRTL